MIMMDRGLRTVGQAMICLALLAVSTAHAQSGNFKVGVVNIGRLLEEAPQTQDAMTALQDEFAPRQRELVALQTELTEKSETYQRDAPVMGEEERVNLERELTAGQRDLQRSNDELTEDYNIRRNEELNTLQRSLLAEVQTYARAAAFDLVVADVLYYSSAVDITADVLASMQANYQQENGG